MEKKKINSNSIVTNAGETPHTRPICAGITCILFVLIVFSFFFYLNRRVIATTFARFFFLIYFYYLINNGLLVMRVSCARARIRKPLARKIK